jgi:hypothetical protein
MKLPQEYANCAECGQARQTRVLNAAGVCPWCLLTVILSRPNPYLK